MCDQPFIRNHDYNFIQKQADYVLHALRTVGDPKIVASVRSDAQAKAADLFPDVTDHRRTILESIADVKSAEDVQQYMRGLEPYRIAYPPITGKQIQGLFPKNKKLKLPDLAQIDFRRVSYLSWTDIATNKMFLVYPAGDGFVGLEGRFTASSKKSYCFACNRLEDVVLFSANFKKKPANASPDYYKTVGNYICANGEICNKNIAGTASLEQFIEAVLG